MQHALDMHDRDTEYPPRPMIVPLLGGTTQPVPMQLMGCTTWGLISHTKQLGAMKIDQESLVRPRSNRYHSHN